MSAEVLTPTSVSADIMMIGYVGCFKVPRFAINTLVPPSPPPSHPTPPPTPHHSLLRMMPAGRAGFLRAQWVTFANFRPPQVPFVVADLGLDSALTPSLLAAFHPGCAPSAPFAPTLPLKCSINEPRV